MSKLPTLPEIGRLVEVTRGRDRGSVGVVIRQEADRFVYVADGAKHPIDKPKKKNVLHVRSTRVLSMEVIEDVESRGQVTDAKLRYVINQYLAGRARAGADNEGGYANGER